MKTPTLLLASIRRPLSAFLAALCFLTATTASAVDFYYNSFRNNNGNTAAAGNKYYTYYGGTYTLYTSPGTWFFTSATFVNTYTTEVGTATHGDSPIYVDANGISGEAVFYGTNIYVRSERAAASSSQAVSIRNAGIVYLFSSTLEKVNTSADVSEGVFITDKSLFHGEDITINVSAPAVSGISLASGAATRMELIGATISCDGNTPGINFAGNGSALLVSTTIYTTGSYAPGIEFNPGIAYLEYKGGAIRVTGSSSPGIWAGINNASSHIVAKFDDIDVRSEDGAGLAINTQLNNTRSPNNAVFNDNSGIYEFSFENSTISGALGSVHVTSAATRRTGATVYEIPTRLILKLSNSKLTNDIVAFSRARLDLEARATTLDGNLRAEDATTINGIFASSTITGAIIGTGASTLDISCDSTTITRGVELSGSATAILRLANSSTLNGAITVSDNATLDARLDPTSSLHDNLFIDRGATFRLAVSGGGSITLPGFALLGKIELATAKTTITGPIILGSDATITLANVTGNDLTLAAGVTGTGFLSITSIDRAVLNQPEIRVIIDQTNNMAPTAFTLVGDGTVDLGIASYTLENRPDGAWLIGGLNSGSYGAAFGAIYNTRAAEAVSFFHSLAPIYDHLADLRTRGNVAGGTFWANVHAGSLRADSDDIFPSFDQTSVGLIVGGDTHWSAAASSIFTTGFFGDISYIDREFTRGTDGSTDSYAFGLYAAWRHPVGWFAAATARFDSQKHNFEAITMDGDYRTNAVGASLEFGRRFAFPARAWWIEPSVQAGLVNLQSATYATDSASDANRVTVRASGVHALRYRAQARVGWSPSNSPLRFHAALAYAADDINGGEIRVGDLPAMRHILESRHVEASLGSSYDFGRNSLYLDLAAAFGSSGGYTLPWRLSLGYNHAW